MAGLHYTDPMFREVNTKLHKLWTWAVGLPGYDKKAWRDLEQGIIDLAKRSQSEPVVSSPPAESDLDPDILAAAAAAAIIQAGGTPSISFVAAADETITGIKVASSDGLECVFPCTPMVLSGRSRDLAIAAMLSAAKRKT